MSAHRKFVAVGFGLWALMAYAGGNMNGTLTSQMVLQDGCVISSALPAGGSGSSLGTLDFGVQPSTFTGLLLANATGSAGATQITCSPAVTSLSVSVSGGNNAGQGTGVGLGSRAMKLGSSYLPYEVYSDATMTTVYPATGSTVGVLLPNAGTALPLPVFGRIQKTSGAAMPTGTYSDVLQVTLSW